MKQTHYFLLLPISITIVMAQGCYPIGEGGAIFFQCYNCVSASNIYISVDGTLFGEIDMTYAVSCSPDCKGGDGTYPTFTGSAGTHTFMVKDVTGRILQSSSFTINKQKCTQVQVYPSGCTATSGGGGSGGNCNYTTYSGNTSCTSGDVSVPNGCCPASTPYSCTSNFITTCFATCEDAATYCGSNIVYYGSANGTGSCNYSNYAGANMCGNAGLVQVSATDCCPSATPYSCSSSGGCWSTCEAASASCNGTVIKGH